MNTKNHYLFIRHGENDANILKASNTHNPEHPFHLTEKGIIQAKNISEKINKILKFNECKLFSSPFIRCKETANYVKEKIPSDIILDNRLCEVGEANLDGAPFAHLYYREEDIEKSYDFPPEGAESFEKIKERLISFIKMCEQNFTDKNIIAVTHGNCVKMLSFIREEKADKNNIIKDWNKTSYLGNGEIYDFNNNKLI